MNLQESGEMYLETILVLSKRNKDVRSIDIAHELNYCLLYTSDAADE